VAYTSQPSQAGPQANSTARRRASESDSTAIERLPTASVALPLPSLAVPDVPTSTFYTISPMDRWGRLADRSPLLKLDWRPGVRLAIVLAGDVIVAAVERTGRYRLAAHGHLQLPASVRHAAHVQAGDRLLLAACHQRDLLIAYPPAILDAVVSAYQAGSVGAVE
jgi:hypothetical protein